MFASLISAIASAWLLVSGAMPLPPPLAPLPPRLGIPKPIHDPAEVDAIPATPAIPAQK